jgi:urease accessory protein
MSVMAHTEGGAHGFMAGALHPLGGLDHLLATLAVGLLAGNVAGNMRRWLPISFVAALAAGTALGATGVGGPFIEVGIACSLIAFGSLLIAQQSLRAPTLVVLTAGFALLHGHAHGAEMSVDLSALRYASGLILASTLLIAIGAALAARTSFLIQRATLLRWSGGAIAAVGVVSLGMLLVIPA